MNTANKIFTFVIVLISNLLNSEDALLFWGSLAIIGVIPAFFVKEDLRRLNMRDVGMSVFIEEKDLMKKTYDQREEIFR